MIIGEEPSQYGRITLIDQIGIGDRDSMFSLMAKHYCGVSRAAFDADLADKSWVIQVVDPITRAIRGFSTQKLIQLEVSGRHVYALFSGDTIIDREHWGSRVLLRTWGKLALQFIDDCEGELYWYVVCQAIRTYRLFPTFFREFYPRYDVATPPQQREVLAALGRTQFGDA
jgi:hypothetical protein